MQTLSLRSCLIAPDSAKPFCFYTAWSSEGAVTSLKQALGDGSVGKGSQELSLSRNLMEQQTALPLPLCLPGPSQSLSNSHF